MHGEPSRWLGRGVSRPAERALSVPSSCHLTLATAVDSLPEGDDDLVFNSSVMSRALGRKTRFGTLEEQHIRRAAARVLRTQFLLGELDGPSQVPQQKIDTAVVDSAEHRALALRAARESIVLLEHDGNTLPLAASARVAFIGPHVNTTQGFLSDYHGFRDVGGEHVGEQLPRGLGL